MKKLVLFFSFLTGVSAAQSALAGDAFSFLDIQMTATRDEGKAADGFTVYARTCIHNNIYSTNGNPFVPYNCSIPMASDPDSNQPVLPTPVIELTFWNPKMKTKVARAYVANVKAQPLPGGAINVKASNEKYDVNLIVKFKYDEVSGGLIQAEGNTLTFTDKTSGGFGTLRAEKPTLTVHVTSEGN